MVVRVTFFDYITYGCFPKNKIINHKQINRATGPFHCKEEEKGEDDRLGERVSNDAQTLMAKWVKTEWGTLLGSVLKVFWCFKATGVFTHSRTHIDEISRVCLTMWAMWMVFATPKNWRKQQGILTPTTSCRMLSVGFLVWDKHKTYCRQSDLSCLKEVMKGHVFEDIYGQFAMWFLQNQIGKP